MFSLLTAHPCIHVDVKIKFSFYPSYMNPDKFNASDGNIDLQYSFTLWQLQGIESVYTNILGWKVKI